MQQTLSDQALLRYSRQIVLPEIDVAGQWRLAQSWVLIVGLGGLGSPVALYLAVAGIGTLCLADGDSVTLSNLQRQILYNTEDLEQPKVQASALHLRALNPELVLEVHCVALEGAFLVAAVERAEVVVDCSDNFATRYALNAACVASGRPLVSGAAVGTQGQLCVFDPRDSNSPCYQCLFGADTTEVALACSENGVLGPLVGLLGGLQALEVLKLLVGFGRPLVGRLLLVDGLLSRFKEVQIPKDSACMVCGGVHVR